LGKLLAAEGYDVLLLPVVLGIVGTLFECLDRATNDMDNPNPKKKLYSKLHLHIYTICKVLCPNGDTWEKQKPTAEAKARGRMRGR
jgi:hypothetical protein